MTQPNTNNSDEDGALTTPKLANTALSKQADNLSADIDHSIDVRYAPDLETAFNRFIEKWCPEYYPHLIDSDDNDGQFIRNKIAQEANKARIDELHNLMITGGLRRKTIDERIAQLKAEKGSS